ARLAAESGEEPAALRQRVTSKKGTTEAALKQFQKSAVGAGIERGVLAAARRSRELSR
ncbi:MAG: pyrroline-5-carboxylate reductase, partial [Candidatus Omnitrophica bacterium CG11_big_fil_rev_8_21_14_0_20_64_10]